MNKPLAFVGYPIPNAPTPNAGAAVPHTGLGAGVVIPDLTGAWIQTPGVELPSSIGAIRQPAAHADGIRVYRRMPDAGLDPKAPRSFTPDEYMAIEPQALERAFFPFFFGEEEKPYDMHGAVAVVSIDGPLMQRGGWWWDGYEQIRERFEKALEDKAVGAVVLKISSPGGVVAGCFAQARAMRDAKAASGKPVYAVADESAYSAAYAMACIADTIYVPREGGVGSVGVIGVLEDYSEMNANLGIKVAVITSGKHKADGHPDVPLTADVITRYQKRINMLADSFAELVGEARQMAPAAVLRLEADCFYGDEAVRVGLATGVKSFEEVLDLASAEAARRLASRPLKLAAAAASSTEEGADTDAAEKNMGKNANGTDDTKTNNDGIGVHAFGTLEMSHADFALMAGLSHEATKPDILAAMAASKANVDKLLAVIGVSTVAAAIGTVEAERATQGELVKAIIGDAKDEKGNPLEATTANATARIAADRKAADRKRAEQMIAEAKAAGKTAGEKALGLFDDHGMAAFQAHLDALPVHTALTATAPTQRTSEKPAQPGAKAAKAVGTAADGPSVVLTKDEEKMIKQNGLNRDAFIKRKAELAVEREAEAADASDDDDDNSNE